jgi:uncharacterized YigZ family protein
MEPYKLPCRTAIAEFTEKKSRFISNIAPVTSEEDALIFLRSIRAEHREASHNVYAYRIKNNNVCRYSDDGEPSGTAGMPLMEVFLKQDIYDFCCIATRYFGGILLGAGGLVRAYARCGGIALEAAGVSLMREITVCSTSLPYSRYETVKRLLDSCGVYNITEDFGVEVLLTFSLPSEEFPTLEKKFTELTAGTAQISKVSKHAAVFHAT